MPPDPGVDTIDYRRRNCREQGPSDRDSGWKAEVALCDYPPGCCSLSKKLPDVQPELLVEQEVTEKTKRREVRPFELLCSESPKE
jgi:hypothetical protein